MCAREKLCRKTCVPTEWLRRSNHHDRQHTIVATSFVLRPLFWSTSLLWAFSGNFCRKEPLSGRLCFTFLLCIESLAVGTSTNRSCYDGEKSTTAGDTFTTLEHVLETLKRRPEESFETFHALEHCRYEHCPVWLLCTSILESKNSAAERETANQGATNQKYIIELKVIRF